MAKFSYDDDEPAMEKARSSAKPTQAPTFAQLQQRGMPRPPPASSALYGAAGMAPPQYSTAPSAGAQGAGGRPGLPNGGGFGGKPPQAQPYLPTNQLNQGNLEGYLYDMLNDPTSTPSYQNIMRKVGADVDVDASKRGVFHSTIPVGAYSQAGSDLAGQLQQQAFGNLRGYNQDYEQLLMQLLGST